MVNIAEKTNEYFKLSEEAYFKQGISLTVRQMCYYGINWLESKSYRQIIQEDINFHSRHLNPDKRINPNNDKDVNDRINEIIKIHSQIVSYLLVKYFKLLNDIVYSIMPDDEKDNYKFALSLPTMLELGTTEPVVIQLISSGISRSVALKVFSVFEKVENFRDKNIFDWLSTQTTIGLKGIYERYLKRINVINVDRVES